VAAAARTIPIARLPAVDELRDLGMSAGLDAFGVTAAAPWPESLAQLRARKHAGYDAGMPFTYRNPERATDPRRSLPDAASLVVGAVGYRRRPVEAPVSRPGPFARVAAYAWSDHQERLRVALRAVAVHLKEAGWRARVMIDDNALVDRTAAHHAGIGWFGKNANLLLPGQGSWFVLGSVLTSAPLSATEAVVPDGCGACRRCLDGCPTGAIVAPGVIDGNRCLSWLLQIDGDLPRDYREAVGDRIYGCDDCQDVCPENRRADDAAPPPDAEPESVASVDVLDLLDVDDETILARHGEWYIPRRDPDQVRRNALVVLGNTADPADERTAGALRRYLRHPNPVLRRHATWACRRLGRTDLVASQALDAAVADEMAAPAPVSRAAR
jgi:epoxyqueuosine reductase